MEHKYLTTTSLMLAACIVFAGCDDAAEKKAREAEREKVKAQEEVAKRMLRRNPSDYTPAEIDTSMAPKPAATPSPGNGLNPKPEGR